MPRPAESLERRAAQITISAFFAGPDCLPFICHRFSAKICDPSYVRSLQSQSLKVPFSWPRMMCLLNHGMTATRKNIRRLQQQAKTRGQRSSSGLSVKHAPA